MAGAEYDAENVFAKMIDGKASCFKVFESKATLAFLDAFPMVEGHTLVIPKAKGSKAFTDMPPAKASEFLRDLQHVAKAVKEATGADGVNIWNNNGEAAGQAVFHPHFHIVPRKTGDGLMKYPESAKEMITKEKAEPILEKMNLALNPPKPLKKAKFMKVSSIRPDTKGANFKVQILEEPKAVEAKKGTLEFFEALAGDESGSMVLSLRSDQKDLVKNGKTIEVRNGAAKMVAGYIRVTVDKWGKIADSDEPVEGNKAADKNISATEYELIKN
eukprot:gnl/TRDRNA2_/TRDRNA2_132584_c0_seq2.p1 gnl/TRDRNA2_/TRDRNA2_132584_c0~~gnl/TRDRNA2_/TRDRNA2_132584_c0_seq2.p1  ORF type:complete len:273 (+),score=90.06 gnl/TRDRNA2_/TRDRNA2_132584_c0_seq2:65-883(+)